MQFYYKEQKVRKGYIAAFGLLMISYFLVFFTLNQLEKKIHLVAHTNEVINNFDNLLACIKYAESGFRGALIIRDTAFMRQFNSHSLCINASFDSLHYLIGTDTLKRRRLDSLRILIETKWELMDLTFREFLSQGHPSEKDLIDRILQGTAIMNDIEINVKKSQAQEKSNLEERTSEYENISDTLRIIQLTTFIIAILLIVYSMRVYNRVSRAMLSYREQLETGIDKLKIANEDLVNLRSIEKFAASGRIARTIAHEIRNPLTSISLASEQISSNLTENNENRNIIEIINRNIRRIDVLIQELLNSTKFSQLNLSVVSLNHILEQSLAHARDRLELNGLKVIKKLTDDPCLVHADAEKMNIAFLNLIVNSIEAVTPGEGILEIGTSHRKDKCVAYVKDNGMGMSENSLSRIFEPYFTQKENGNGLGLTLSQNIILNHKGTIHVESSPGNGTIFTITLNHVNNENL